MSERPSAEKVSPRPIKLKEVLKDVAPFLPGSGIEPDSLVQSMGLIQVRNKLGLFHRVSMLQVKQGQLSEREIAQRLQTIAETREAMRRHAMEIAMPHMFKLEEINGREYPKLIDSPPILADMRITEIRELILAMRISIDTLTKQTFDAGIVTTIEERVGEYRRYLEKLEKSYNGIALDNTRNALLSGDYYQPNRGGRPKGNTTKPNE